jgi:hypothetical protein
MLNSSWRGQDYGGEGDGMPQDPVAVGISWPCTASGSCDTSITMHTRSHENETNTVRLMFSTLAPM